MLADIMVVTFKVLHANDYDMLRKCVRELFEDYEEDVKGSVRFEMDEAESGKAAASKLEARPYDLVILDVNMEPYKDPGASIDDNLLNLCETARGRNPKVSIVLNSTEDESRLKQLKNFLRVDQYYKGTKDREHLIPDYLARYQAAAAKAISTTSALR